jgi:hypothetical protein
MAVTVTIGGRTYRWREGDHPRDPDGKFVDTPGGGGKPDPKPGPKPKPDVGASAPTERVRARQLDKMSNDDLHPLAEQYRPHVVEDYDGDPPRRVLISEILNGERRAGLIREAPSSSRSGGSVTDARQASQDEADYTAAITAVTNRTLDIAEMPRPEVAGLYRQATGNDPSSNMSRQWMASAITGHEARQGLLPDLLAFTDRVPERRRRSLANAVDREERARRRGR